MKLSNANMLGWQESMHKLEYFVESGIFYTKLMVFSNLLVVHCLSMTYTSFCFVLNFYLCTVRFY